MNKKLCSIIMAGIITAGTVLSSIVTIDAYSSYERIAGENRYETSLKVSALNKSSNAVIASGHSFADALSSINIANKYNASVILSDGKKDLNGILKSRGVSNVYIVGGVNTLPKSLETRLREDFTVTRIAGSDRYMTSRETLKKTGYKDLGVADGRNYPDALSASALLRQDNLGLLLVDGGKSYKKPDGTSIVYTFGGTMSVSQSGGKRIAGVNRYDTAIKVARKIINQDVMAVVSGEQYADALSATNLVISEKAFVMPVSNYPYHEVRIFAKNADKVIFVGGENSVSENAENSILGKESDDTYNPDRPYNSGHYKNIIDGIRNDSSLTDAQKRFLEKFEKDGARIIEDLHDVKEALNRLINSQKLDIVTIINGLANINERVAKIVSNINNFLKYVNDNMNIMGKHKDKIKAAIESFKNIVNKEIQDIKAKIASVVKIIKDIKALADNAINGNKEAISKLGVIIGGLNNLINSINQGKTTVAKIVANQIQKIIGNATSAMNIVNKILDGISKAMNLIGTTEPSTSVTEPPVSDNTLPSGGNTQSENTASSESAAQSDNKVSPDKQAQSDNEKQSENTVTSENKAQPEKNVSSESVE